jgi:hypothetical protein
MNVPKIYAETIEGEIFDDGETKTRMHYFYLDGEAEEINGYDICEGNIQALSMAMNQNVFEAVLVFWDGSKKGCKVWSYYDRDIKRMRGYVWLQNDETVAPFINRALDKSEIVNTDYTVDKEGKIHFKHETK